MIAAGKDYLPGLPVITEGKVLERFGKG
jgi:hypothetical protein